MTPIPSPDAPPLPPPLRLRHALLLRLGAAVLGALLALGLADALAWRAALLRELPATATVVATLLDHDMAGRATSFDRFDLRVPLAPLAPLAQRLDFCVEVQDLRRRDLAAGCLPEPADGPATDLHRAVGAWARAWLGAPTASEPLHLPGRLVAGRITVSPHWTAEGRRLLGRAGLLAAVALGLGLLMALGTRLVARALAPANGVLLAIARLAGGDLQVRLPPLRLQELRDIGEGFNRLAERWGATQRAQRRLAQTLLHVREAERQHLARELHDEMGQGLTALQAEAAALALLAGRDFPAAAEGAQAMGRTTAQLLDGLQRILGDLRPQALDRFGLPAALRTLADLPRRGADGRPLGVLLQVDEGLPLLPPDHEVQVYRIVQEALTNVARHGRAAQAQVRLQAAPDGLSLTVEDDGPGLAAPPPPGRGMVGMRERVAVLGGQIDWTPAGPAGGLRLRVHLPWPAAASEDE